MAGRFLLALDQSTQSTKAFVLDASGAIVAKAARPHRQYYPEAGRVEHDPTEILANARAALAEAVESAGIDPADIAALCVTNQRETIVAWDAETGRPLHNALVWQDDRGAPLCAELEARGYGPLVRGRTGLAIDPYYSASKLAWLARNSEPVRASLASGRLMAGTMDSWLIWNLVLWFATFILFFVFFIGVLLIPVAAIFSIAWVVLTIIGGLKANEGKPYRYPLTIRFFT